MTVYATRLTSGSDTAERMRLSDSLNVSPTGALNSLSGLRPGGGTVSVVASTMDVEVSPCIGWVNGDSAPQQAGYPVTVNATEILTLTDGDAAQDRIDLIVLRVYDDIYDNTGMQQAAVEVVEGTPGDTSAPVVPLTSLPLREVTVPAGTSAGTGGLSSGNLGTDRRSYTASLGGVIPVSGASERQTLAQVAGLTTLEMSSGALYVSDGSDWLLAADPANRPQAGTYQGDVPESETRYNTSITFDRPFSAPPVVICGPQDVSWSDRATVDGYAITETGFLLRFMRHDGSTGPMLCGWQAIPATQ